MRPGVDDAVDLVLTLLSLEGNDRILADMVEGARASGFHAAVQAHDTPALYDWLMGLLSLQGISDQIAFSYIDKWGNATYADMARRLATTRCACPKLGSFASYTGCGYRKGKGTCANPQHLRLCPVRQLPLRKGLLNVQAVSLFYWLSDRCRGDLVAMIDRTIQEAKEQGSGTRDPSGADGHSPHRPDLQESEEVSQGNTLGGGARDTTQLDANPGSVSPYAHPVWAQAAKAALITSLSSVEGVSAKLANMSLAELMIGGRPEDLDWRAVAVQMVAVDSLVHNHLERTGILAAFGAEHKYGPACYGSTGCEAVILTLATLVGARNAAESSKFADLGWPTALEVQKAIWRFCTQGALDTCNAVRVGPGPACKLAASCPLGRSCATALISHDADGR